jgi:diguanylate cyclase (GGDEF)-like protein
MQLGTLQITARWRRLAPFSVAALLGFLAMEPPAAPAWFPPVYWLAACVLALCAVAGGTSPRRAWRHVPPLAYVGALPVLWLTEPRLGTGSVALGLLPVLWLVLYASRPPLAAALLGGVAVSAWGGQFPRTAFWACVTVVVALAVQALVEVAQRADLLAEREHVLRSVHGLSRCTVTGHAARRAICDAAVAATRADLAYVVEQTGSGGWTSTAASASDLPVITIDPAELRRGLTAPGPHLAAAGATALAVQPVHRDGLAVAVLVVGWRAAVASVHALEALDLLAGESAAVLERADLLAGLAAEARHDTLTGLANRRAWDERLAQELARTRRSGHPLSVALLDLDRFKLFNDRHGHQAGDRLLKEAAAAWRGELRATDLLARWGGEEFGVLLPACPAGEALVMLERLRARTPGGQTCSVGVAEWLPGEDADMLLGRADLALYQAKRTGRDRAVAAPALIVDLTEPGGGPSGAEGPAQLGAVHVHDAVPGGGDVLDGGDLTEGGALRLEVMHAGVQAAAGQDDLARGGALVGGEVDHQG